MFARYASAITTGTLVTLALLYAMQGLIELQPGVQSEAPPPIDLDWIRPPREETPPPPPEPAFDKKTMTEAPIPPTGAPHNNSGTPFHFPEGTGVPIPLDTTLERVRDPDGPLISIVRVQPTYPAIAQARGLEGWVDVRFDVLITGQVTNIVVTASSDGIFERAAIRAAKKFRFRAPVVDGVPQIATDVDFRFRFDMYD